MRRRSPLPARRPVLAVVLAVAVAAALPGLPGCARFDDRLADPFTPVPAPAPGGSEEGPSPAPAPPSSREPSPPSSSTPPGPCTDPDPAVIATCLDPSSAVVALPGGKTALVGDATGRLVRVNAEAPQQELARVDTGGGTLVALALSPKFDEDHLYFALLSTGGGARVVRFATGDAARTVLDLPGSAGGLAFVGGDLVVAAGDQAVRYPKYTGVGAPPPPTVLASGLGSARGLCVDDTEVYATADGPGGVTVRRVDVDRPVWSWADQQRAGGCAAGTDGISVALPLAERVDLVPLAEGAVRGQPQPLAEHRYGRLTGVAAIADGVLVGTTTNKDGGAPTPTDDRAVLLPSGGSAGGDSRV